MAISRRRGQSVALLILLLLSTRTAFGHGFVEETSPPTMSDGQPTSLHSSGASAPDGPRMQTIDIGESVAGTLGPESERIVDGTYADWYAFRAEAGDAVIVQLTSDDFDAYLVLADEDDNLLAQDDDSGGGTDALLFFTFPEAGVYRIIANAFFPGEGGDYVLSLERQAEPVPEKTIDMGGRVRGTLGPGNEQLFDGTFIDYYRFEGTAGDKVAIRMQSEAFNSFLVLLDEDDDVLAVDDDSGAGPGALIVYTLPYSGLYWIAVNAVAPGDEGAYTLSVQPWRGADDEEGSTLS